MISRFCKTLLLLLCCWLLTGPQLLLQLGAWTWMVASYSQESTIEQAFKDTFGGERPCDLCEIITAVDRSDRDSTHTTGESTKLTLMLEMAQPIIIGMPSTELSMSSTRRRTPESALPTVPTPPPRLV